MDEYSSLPPQIAEWYWCIEYVAKFVKDLPCLLDLMNMGYPVTNDYGRRINELLSLRVLEFLFYPNKNDATLIGPKIQFDLSLSNTHVLNAILKHIPLSELRPGMPELSNFNLLPFIAHKNTSLPQCALEKLMRVVSATKNPSSAAPPPMESHGPVSGDDPSAHMDVCEEQVHTGTNKNDVEDNVLGINNDKDDPMQSNGRDDEVNVIAAEQSIADVSAAPPPMESHAPVSRDDPSAHMDVGEEQVHTGTNQNDLEDNVLVINDDEDDPMQTNGRNDEVIVIGAEQSIADVSAAPPLMESHGPVSRDDPLVQMDVCEEQVHTGKNKNDLEDNVLVINNEDDPMQTNGRDDEVVVIGAQQSINDNGNATTRKTFSPSSLEVRAKYRKDGALLISESDDDDEESECPASSQKNANICCKCEREEGASLLLTCSRSECAAKVHKECLNCEANFDEDGNFLCPMCWYDRITMEYNESHKLMTDAKRRLVKFLPLLCRASKRLR